MARKNQLRGLHESMILNATSLNQEKSLVKAVKRVAEDLIVEFRGIELRHR